LSGDVFVFFIAVMVEQRSTERLAVPLTLLYVVFKPAVRAGAVVKRSEKLSADVFCCLYFAIKDCVNVQRQWGTAMNYTRALGCLALKN